MYSNFPARVFKLTSKKLCHDTALVPKHLHRMSIASPSLLHRNDGLTMEYRWSIDGVSP